MRAKSIFQQALSHAQYHHHGHNPSTYVRNFSHGSDHLSKAESEELLWKNARPFQEVPGPKPLPIIGNNWRFLPKIGEYYDITPHEMFRSLHKKYGDIVQIGGVVGNQHIIYLFNPSDIEKVYKLESSKPIKSLYPETAHFRDKEMHDVYKDAKGLITTNGTEWHDFRSKVNPILLQPKLIKQYLHPLDKIARELVKKIKKIRDEDNKLPIDFMDEMKKWSLESVAVLALNMRLGCLTDFLPLDSNTRKMITITDDIFEHIDKFDFKPSIWKYVSTPMFRKAMHTHSEHIKLSEKYVHKAIEKLKASKGKPYKIDEDVEVSVLEKLLEIDPKLAVVTASDLLMAGVNTTSTAFTNILYLLSINHPQQELLRGEIISLLPQKKAKLTVDHLSAMPYLKAFIKESARLYPTTPGSLRMLTKDTVLSGYKIPKGMITIFPHMYLSVQENQFTRPLEFIPERWLREEANEDLSHRNAHSFCTKPFGYGARSCIGQRFADLQLEVAVVNFLRNFNIHWNGPTPEKETSSLNTIRGPYHFVFKNNDIDVQGDIACIKNQED